VMERCEQLGIRNVAFHCIGIPDEYVHHGSQDVLRAQYDLHAEGIARRVREFVGEQRHATVGDVARLIDEIYKDVPDEEFAKLPGSDRIDEVVYGLRRRVAK
jgi:hypothetical protein